MKVTESVLLKHLVPVQGRLARTDMYDTVPSTNDLLLESEPPLRGFHLCVSTGQSAGKGRRGRVWHSPPGGVYLSLSHRIPKPQASRAHVAGLGLAIATELAHRLNEQGAVVVVKPPNDIICASGKLAGVLVETTEQHCVMGVGLNWVRPAEALPSTAVPPAYLCEPGNGYDERDYPGVVALIVAGVIRAFDKVFEHFVKDTL